MLLRAPACTIPLCVWTYLFHVKLICIYTYIYGTYLSLSLVVQGLDVLAPNVGRGLLAGMLDLAKLGRKKFVSQSALADILRAVRDADSLPAGISRSSVKRKREEAVDVETPFGPVQRTWQLQGVNGKAVEVHYLHPAAMVWYCHRSCNKFRSFLDRRLREHPSSIHSKWGLLFYSDEITPGNALKPSNSRKLQAIYYSFREFGPDALGHEHAWFLLRATRTKTVRQLRDGMSQLCRAAIESFFQTPGNFAHGLQMEGHFLCANISMVVSDESALKMMFANKGASGKLLCMLCRNVVRTRYAPNPLTAPLVLHTCLREDRFLQHDLHSLKDVVQHLAERSTVLNKGDMDELEIALGFNHAPCGPLSSDCVMEHMDPTKCLCYDWMHIYLVGGLFHLEANLLLQSLAPAKIKVADLHAFSNQFQWPAVHGAGAKHVFQDKKQKDDWRSSASDALSAFPVMRVWAEELRQRLALPEHCQEAIRCFLLACNVLVSWHACEFFFLSPGFSVPAGNSRAPVAGRICGAYMCI